MGDKDSVARFAVKNVFGLDMYICSWHSLKIFKRSITVKDMKITEEQVEKSLKLIQNMMYCSCKNEYDKIYEEFSSTVPEVVLTYFDKNWHNIYEQWTRFSMINYNLNNFTNNRLESLNQKIKLLISKSVNFEKFINLFFIFLLS